jgi:hypothetical protein
MRKMWIGAAAVVLGLVVLILWPAPADRGQAAFFKDPAYNFEAVRVLNDVAAAGGDSGEALQAIANAQCADRRAQRDSCVIRCRFRRRVALSNGCAELVAGRAV